jgi:asparagine synthase (glutamine-hydrolysing)
MCGILVSTDVKTDPKEFERGLARLRDRGPDDERMIIRKEGLFGFARLAVMGLTERGMQPFERDGMTLVCNGELYGFRPVKKELEKKYAFVSNSDCEIILPLYEEKGLDMFRKLDAEFAMCFYDPARGFIAARDPIGIRPLFYGYTENGKICFGSTVASLQPIADDIRPFPPGTYYCDGEFWSYTEIYHADQVIRTSLEDACTHIHDLLYEGVLKRMDADAKAGYLLSGGLDSSLVCAIAQRHSDQPIRTFSIGMDTDAIDLKYAREVADFIHSDHTEFTMTREDILKALPEVIRALGSWDITTIRASLGMYLLCKKIHETTDIKVLMTGEVSDELFGYKYTDFAPDAESFQKEAEKRVRELYMYDVLRADRCISQNSMEGRVPFGDLAFVRYVMALDPAMKMNTYHMGKFLLRHAFEQDDLLPKDILFRDKAAFSDAVGHSLADDLKAYAEEKYTDEEFEEGRRKYSWCPPFTKESLLYRDIFEQYYPGEDTLIADYWMPNRAWKGCQVNDPSARYLSNYGASAY